MTSSQMTANQAQAAAEASVNSSTLTGLAVRLTALALIDAFAVWFLYVLVRDGNWFLALTVGVVTLGINAFYLRDDLYAYRWFAPGLALMGVMVIYPTVFTMYVAFTNYRDGNLLTKPQALQRLMLEQYAAEDSPAYAWTAYRNEAGETILWLQDDNEDVFIGRAGEPFQTPVDLGIEGDEPPDQISDYTKLSPFVAAADPTLSQIAFGVGETAVKIPSNGGDARELRPLYTYDEEMDTLTNNETGVVYTPQVGTFTSPDGEQIRPGYYVVIGLDNFQRLFTTQLFGGGEIVQVFIWTFLHAFLAVFVTFAVGLSLAIVLNHPLVPAQKILRSVILIPYAIPAFISVIVWRGLLDPNLGVINQMLEAITFGAVALDWKGSAFWARTAIILIQMWLGFPYMLLITTGALQGIPADMYEAADVDGAGPFTKFWKLTLPLLLVAVGPLLIASFAFNFNNFTVIQLYNDGRPTISTDSVAGYTDVLITYTYEVAFSSGRGRDFGFATAITILIFVLLTIVTIFNFRLTRRLEEISENV